MGPLRQANEALRCCRRFSIRRRLPHWCFRGSITQLLLSLSTLRSRGRPRTTQDSVPDGGQPFPGGISLPAGFHREVSGHAVMVFLLTQALPGAHAVQSAACAVGRGSRASWIHRGCRHRGLAQRPGTERIGKGKLGRRGRTGGPDPEVDALSAGYLGVSSTVVGSVQPMSFPFFQTSCVLSDPPESIPAGRPPAHPARRVPATRESDRN